MNKTFIPMQQNFTLIKTKLNPPPQNAASLLTREYLQPIATNYEDYKAVLFTAPAGYGKSTAMSTLQLAAEKKEIATTWLSLDNEDNDVMRFTEYLVAAFGFLDEKIAEKVKQEIKEIDPSRMLDTALHLLLEQLQSSDKHYMIFLDDLHIIEEKTIYKGIEWLILNTPPNVQFVIGSRTTPKLSLSKFKVRSQLIEFNINDLCFNFNEIKTFFRELKGLNLDERSIRELAKLTEGWIAALQLVAIALDKTENYKKFVEDFSGTDKDITDYLAEVVLNHLTTQQRKFLLAMSLFDRFCASLGRAVTNEKNSYDLLEFAHKNNLFLIPLDRSNNWFRFHHLFGQFLRDRCFSENLINVQECYLRASDWFAKNDYPSEAIYYTFTSKNFRHAAKLVASYALDVVYHSGQHNILVKWVSQLPDEYMDAWPEIRIAYSWSLIFMQQYTNSERELEKIERIIQNSKKSQIQSDLTIKSIQFYVKMNYAVLLVLTLRPNESLKYSQALINQHKEFDNTIYWGHINLAAGLANVSLGSYEKGLSYCKKSYNVFSDLVSYYGISWATVIYAIALMSQGKNKQAKQTLIQCINKKEEFSGSRLLVIGLQLLLAYIYYEQGDLDKAMDIVEMYEHDQIMQTINMASAVFIVILFQQKLLSQLNYIKGENSLALDVLKTAKIRADGKMQYLLSAQFSFELVNFYLKQNNISRLEKCIADMKQSLLKVNKNSFQYQRIKNLIERCQVNLMIKQGRGLEAITLLDDLLIRVKKQGHIKHIIDVLITLVVACEVAGKKDQAMEVLKESLLLSLEGQFVSIYFNAEINIIKIIHEMLNNKTKHVTFFKHDGMLDYVKKIIGLSIGENSRNFLSATIASPFNLTNRELEILTLLDSGKSDKALSKELFIATGTLKKHLANIYQKLDVPNRTAAVSKAREFSMIN